MGASADTPRAEPVTEREDDRSDHRNDHRNDHRSDHRNDDRDAAWRRGARGAPNAREAATLRPSARVGEAESEPTSPWSREAIEAPLPTVGEIRERWRAELGLADDRVRSRRPPPHRVPSTSEGSTTTGDVVLAGVLVGASIVLAVLTVWLLPPTSRLGGVGADRMPAAAVARWSVDSESPLRPDDVAVGDDVVAVVEADVLVARALDDGVERWRRVRTTGLEHTVAVYGDTVVVVGAGPGGTEIAAIDSATGDVRWQRPESSASQYGLVPTGVIEYAGSGADVVARMLDVGSGVPLGPGVSVTIGRVPGAIVGLVGDELALLDLTTGQIVTPTVAAFGLRAIAPVGDAVVGLTESNDVVLYDDDGRVVDQRPFVSDAFGDFTGRAELFGGVPGTSIGVVASGTSIGFDVGDGRIEQRWEIDGRVMSATETSVGPLGLARLVDPDTGDVGIGIVDLIDGSTVAVTDPDGDREGTATLFADGYVVPPAIGDPDRTIEAIGYDGRERWSFDLDPGSWFQVEGGVLIVVGRDGDLTVRR